MRSKSMITLVALLSLGLGACQKANKPEVVDFNALRQQSLDSKDKAEIIALAAEKLVYSDGFKFSGRQFNAALELDPTNVRARFYRSVLNVAKVNKGGFVKVEPIVEKLDLKAQRDFQTGVDAFPASHTREFLMNGKPTLATENDVQNHAREVQQSLRDVRTTLTALKTEGAEFVAHTSQIRAGFLAEAVLKNCPVTEISPNVYSMPACEFVEAKDIKLNWADFEAAKVVISAYIVDLSMATAYDLKGAENVARKLSRYETVTDEMIVRAVKQQPKLGTLVDVGVLREIVSMGAEGVEALKLAQTQQADLCARGGPNEANRPGYLFIEGFCVDRKAMAGAQTVQASMQGAASIVVKPNYITYFDASKFLNGSITDLKTQLPDKFDKCQQATSLPDPTLGGTFPVGDFVEIQRLDNPGFLNPYCPN